MLAGLGLFLAALALIVAALSQAALALLLAGTSSRSCRQAVFLGRLATANRLAPPGRRRHVVSAYSVLCYYGLIIPVVGVGIASRFIEDFRPCRFLHLVRRPVPVRPGPYLARPIAFSATAAPGTTTHPAFHRNCSHSGGGEAACPPGLKTRVPTPRS